MWKAGVDLMKRYSVSCFNLLQIYVCTEICLPLVRSKWRLLTSIKKRSVTTLKTTKNYRQCVWTLPINQIVSDSFFYVTYRFFLFWNTTNPRLFEVHLRNKVTALFNINFYIWNCFVVVLFVFFFFNRLRLS